MTHFYNQTACFLTWRELHSVGRDGESDAADGELGRSRTQGAWRQMACPEAKKYNVVVVLLVFGSWRAAWIDGSAPSIWWGLHTTAVYSLHSSLIRLLAFSSRGRYTTFTQFLKNDFRNSFRLTERETDTESPLWVTGKESWLTGWLASEYVSEETTWRPLHL
mgnify:CR=1 FL=1